MNDESGGYGRRYTRLSYPAGGEYAGGGDAVDADESHESEQ